jgi:hypothetical protein
MPAPLLPAPEPQDPPGAFLFPDEIIQELTDEETKHGIYTAERLPINKRESVIQLLGEKRPVREIARLLQVHVSTITAVADRFGSEVSDIRERLARKLRRCAWSQLERIERSPDMLPAASIPLAVKLWIDTGELLDGKATARVEHVERVDIFADFPAFCDQLAAEMETKNRAPEIRFAAGKLPAIEADLVEMPGSPAESPASDQHSSVSGASAQEKPADPTPFTTLLPQDPPPPEGGGGGSNLPGAAQSTRDYPSQNFWPNGSFEQEDPEE